MTDEMEKEASLALIKMQFAEGTPHQSPDGDSFPSRGSLSGNV